MGDLIDRQAAIDILNVLPSAEPKITNNKVHLCDSCQYAYITCPSHGDDAVYGDDKGADNICACNKYLPICAEPERKIGKWLKISPAGIYECSECGQAVMTSDIEAYKYCHGCGKRMEK